MLVMFWVKPKDNLDKTWNSTMISQLVFVRKRSVQNHGSEGTLTVFNDICIRVSLMFVLALMEATCDIVVAVRAIEECEIYGCVGLVGMLDTGAEASNDVHYTF
jgi:hypothetical protein